LSGFIKREYDYAIRICAFVANPKKSDLTSISTISKNLFISRPFVAKKVYQLIQKQILKTTQGKERTVSLLVNPTELSIYDILKAMGLSGFLNKYLNIPGFCPLEKFYKIYNFLRKQKKSLINTFEAKKIKDLAFTK